MAFDFPKTVIISRDGSLGVEITEYEGIHSVPNRIAVAAYFSFRAAPRADESRFSVMFSDRISADLDDLEVPDYNDKEANLVQLALAAFGDYLDSDGVPPHTPGGVRAHSIQCFSPKIHEWRERPHATDEEVEEYIESRLFWSWKFNHQDAMITSHDLIRLHVTLADLRRISQLGEGERWVNRGAPPLGVILAPTQAMLRERRQSSAGAAQATPSNPEAQQPTDGGRVFVDPQRLSELRELKQDKHDLRKLIRLCEELNTCNSTGCYFAVAMLTRAILDHVPPIFSVGSFNGVANNYAGSRSFKDSMSHLENSARKIADAYLHERIRNQETVPTQVGVDCSRDLDVLLAEVVRILRA